MSNDNDFEALTRREIDPDDFFESRCRDEYETCPKCGSTEGNGQCPECCKNDFDEDFYLCQECHSFKICLHEFNEEFGETNE